MAVLRQTSHPHNTEAAGFECAECNHSFVCSPIPDYCPNCGEEFDMDIDHQEPTAP